ncbi:MAG: GNAT family N-acetyltransferase [Halobacteriales archaeon]|nr:GNAT family N-acetyltransferase [Halobacteriales archaeon]
MTVEIREGMPDPEAFRKLRERTGLTPVTAEAATRGLPNTIFGVTAVRSLDQRGSGATEEEVVGMGRLVGDDGCFYQVVDVAVEPDYQGRGIGTQVMATLVDWLEANAPSSAYVSLIADVDGFYERFGFEPVAPDSRGMAMRLP